MVWVSMSVCVHVYRKERWCEWVWVCVCRYMREMVWMGEWGFCVWVWKWFNLVIFLKYFPHALPISQTTLQLWLCSRTQESDATQDLKHWPCWGKGQQDLGPAPIPFREPPTMWTILASQDHRHTNEWEICQRAISRGFLFSLPPRS